MEAAARNSRTRAAYQIELHNGNVLDCYDNAIRTRPTCLASIANSANGLYDRIHDVTLSEGDNNAYAAVTYNLNGSATNNISFNLYNPFDRQWINQRQLRQ